MKHYIFVCFYLLVILGMCKIVTAQSPELRYCNQSAITDDFKVAFSEGNLAAIRYLVEQKGFEVSEYGDDVAIAYSRGWRPISLYLLKHGAIMDATSKNYNRFVCKVLEKNDMEMAKILFLATSHPIPQFVQYENYSILGKVRSVEMAKLLLSQNVRVNQRFTVKGDTELFYLIPTKDLTLMTYILDQYPQNFIISPQYGQQLLYTAIDVHSFEMFKYLHQRLQIPLDTSLLRNAISQRNIKILRYLVEDQKMSVEGTDQFGEIYLFSLVDPLPMFCTPVTGENVSSLEICRYLVEHGAAIDGKNQDGKTLLECTEDLTVLQYLQEKQKAIKCPNK